MTLMLATAILSTTGIFKSFTSRKVIPSVFIKNPASLSFTRSVSRSFGLRSSPNFRAFAMAVHKVKLIGPGREEFEFEARDDAYILDSAERAGLDLPYSCRAGACSTCDGS